MITQTMLLIAIRQKNWIEVQTMSGKLAEKEGSGFMKIVENAAGCVAENDNRAEILLSLWAQIRWLEIN